MDIQSIHNMDDYFIMSEYIYNQLKELNEIPYTHLYGIFKR